jgi:hypothetical protein
MIQRRRDGCTRHVRRAAADPRRRMNRIIPNGIVLNAVARPIRQGVATSEAGPSTRAPLAGPSHQAPVRDDPAFELGVNSQVLRKGW